jgi:hypothetical protein
VTLVHAEGLTDVSSSAVRTALVLGGDAVAALHPDVLAYIQQHGLYATPPP